MTDREQFIKHFPIQLSWPEPCAVLMREVLKEANESYVIIYREEKGIHCHGHQYYDFFIYCPTTSFAQAYYHIGILSGKKVVPAWRKLMKKSTSK